MAIGKYKPDYTKRTPGEMVRMRREDMNLSQLQLSLSIGMSLQQVSRIELNISNPTIDTVNRLEEVLGIPLFPAFIKYQKQKRTMKPDLSEIVLAIVSKQKLTVDELKALFDKVVSEYIKRKQ
ncbi:MAG: helix-turn-helix transcriptional regulator [Ruminiclostridium sp.]|nr:helix-turn-helix transcriptional regulator [Ruminiclostridium sp.]